MATTSATTTTITGLLIKQGIIAGAFEMSLVGSRQRSCCFEKICMELRKKKQERTWIMGGDSAINLF